MTTPKRPLLDVVVKDGRLSRLTVVHCAVTLAISMTILFLIAFVPIRIDELRLIAGRLWALVGGR